MPGTIYDYEQASFNKIDEGFIFAESLRSF